MSTPNPLLLYICPCTELHLLLEERIVRDVPEYEVVDHNAWHSFVLSPRKDPSRIPAAAILAEPSEVQVSVAAARLKELYPDCKVFVYGNMPPEMIAHSAHIDGRFSAGYDEDRLVTALREVVAG